MAYSITDMAVENLMYVQKLDRTRNSLRLDADSNKTVNDMILEQLESTLALLSKLAKEKFGGATQESGEVGGTEILPQKTKAQLIQNAPQQQSQTKATPQPNAQLARQNMIKKQAATV